MVAIRYPHFFPQKGYAIEFHLLSIQPVRISVTERTPNAAVSEQAGVPRVTQRSSPEQHRPRRSGACGLRLVPFRLVTRRRSPGGSLRNCRTWGRSSRRCARGRRRNARLRVVRIDDRLGDVGRFDRV